MAETIGRRTRRAAWVLAMVLGLGGCGGGGGAAVEADGPSVRPSAAAQGSQTPQLAWGDAGFQTILAAEPAQTPAQGPSEPTSLTIHYQRSDGNTAGWQVHTWGAGADPGWNQGHNPVRSDAFGAVYDIPLVASSGDVGYLFHRFDDKDHNGADQSFTLKPGKNEIWRRQGDPVTYASPPEGGPPAVPDLRQLRVHYLRSDGNHAAWGLHLWPSSGIDAGRLGGLTLDQWWNPVPFASMPGYAVGAGEVAFTLPVLNPKDDAGRTAVEFIIHGMPPNENDKDGRNDNIRVRFADLTVQAQTADIWLVQGDAKVYLSKPDLRRVSLKEARAYWLDAQTVQWPGLPAPQGVVKLYHSAQAQLVVVKDEPVRGADGALRLASASAVPEAVAQRFGWIGSGPRFSVGDGSVDTRTLLRSQLVLVEEDAEGRVQNATALQHPGALDALYGDAAERVRDLGVRVGNGQTQWKLWAPTAQRVIVYTYPESGGAADAMFPATFDARSGVWTAASRRELRGKTYRFAVEVIVRGVGLVRNLVSDPYAVALSANGQRSGILDLNDPRSMPPGWTASRIPATVQAATDMSIYELHVRDFSAQDASVSPSARGKYLAFAEPQSHGMRHLRALAQAGLTDVHLLPVYDFASVPETGCTTPSPSGGPADPSQQAAVKAAQGSDCFNWGYDPQHYGAPEGSYASDANSLLKRVREFRAMVQGLHSAGLRVGMDVVYNHTSSSGQNERSVLDRVVPGYYHRLNALGEIERSTCCENTATEHRMMAKLMSDTVLRWARDYKIASFRFDLMGHQPRSVMEAMQTRLKTELGREVQLLGEGWNFGEIADGRRFVQASQLSLNGSGIGTFNDRLRDAVRGSSFGEGEGFVGNQGFVNGAWYDANPSGWKSRGELMWMGDLVKAGLAGSIRSYEIRTHWDAQQRLDGLGGQTIGYVTQPGEVVNYVENHDNHTLFDLNAFRLPLGTPREDRARVQILAAALNTFAQGVAYFHAGVDTLRSKSMDRNSYDAGDWFNRLDWTYTDNFFGTGLPLAGENQSNWGVIAPRLLDSNLKPTGNEIAWTRDAFRDLLRIRASTTLLRLRTADDIKARLQFHNTGSAQEPTVVMASIDGQGYAGAGFNELVYIVNVDKQAKQITVDALKAKGFQLHPVHRAPGAADQRVATQAAYDAASGRFSVPARSAVVFVR